MLSLTTFKAEYILYIIYVKIKTNSNVEYFQTILRNSMNFGIGWNKSVVDGLPQKYVLNY